MSLQSFVIYVANKDSDTVSVIDTVYHRTLATLNVGVNPVHTCLTPDKENVIVCNSSSNTVSIIRTDLNVVRSTINIGGVTPIDCVVTPDSSKCFVINLDSQTVSLVNLETFFYVSAIQLSFNPTKLTLSPDGSKLYIAGLDAGSLTVIDVDSFTIINSVTLPESSSYTPVQLLPIPDSDRILYVSSSNPIIALIDTTTDVIAGTPFISVSTIYRLTNAALSPDGNSVITCGSSRNTGLLLSFDISNGNDVVAKTTQYIFSLPYYIEYSLNGTYVLTSNTSSKSVFSFEADNLKNYTPIYLGGSPTHLCSNGEEETMFVLLEDNNELASINLSSSTILSTFQTGITPTSLIGSELPVPVPSDLVVRRPMVFESDTIVLTDGANVHEVNLEGVIIEDSPVTVNGTVTDINNYPITGATVKILDELNHAIYFTETNEYGNYTFSIVGSTIGENNFRILCISPDYNFSRIISVNATPGEELEINIQLDVNELSDSSNIIGSIFDEDNNPLSNAVVSISNNIEGTNYCQATNLGGCYSFNYIFNFGGILTVAKPGYQTDSFLVVITDAHTADISTKLILESTTPTGEIYGIATDEDGNPLSNLPIKLCLERPGAVPLIIGVCPTDENGAYNFSNIPNGSYILEAKLYLNDTLNND